MAISTNEGQDQSNGTPKILTFKNNCKTEKRSAVIPTEHGLYVFNGEFTELGEEIYRLIEDKAQHDLL